MESNLRKLMRPEEWAQSGMDQLTAEQQSAVDAWGHRMYCLGQHRVAVIDKIKYGGRLVVLDDGSRWEVDDVDADVSDLWNEGDSVAIIDDEMFLLEDAERVSVQEDSD